MIKQKIPSCRVHTYNSFAHLLNRISNFRIWNPILIANHSPRLYTESQSKCFENMLDMINLTYFGTQTSIQAGVPAVRTDGGPVAKTTTIRNSSDSAGAAGSTRPPSTLQLQRQSDTTSQQGGAGELQQILAGTYNAPATTKQASSMCLAASADPSKRMKLSQLDFLANPLRTDHPFGKDWILQLTNLPSSSDSVYRYFVEIWSPKEMALFSACIC